LPAHLLRFPSFLRPLAAIFSPSLCDLGRDEDAKRRNSDILELAAKLQFDYDMKRLEEKRQIAAKENELDDLKRTEEEAARQKRRLDTQIDLEAEKTRAKIGGDEKTEIFSEASKLLASVAAIPTPDLSQVRTLVSAANSTTESPRDMAVGHVGVAQQGVGRAPV
jgi:hypothetical protein